MKPARVPTRGRLEIGGVTRFLAVVGLAILLLLLGGLPVQAASPAGWTAARGSYTRADGNQYNSGKLQLLPLDNGCVLFEFDVMAGSESEDKSRDFRLAGTLLLGRDGAGTWARKTKAGAVSLRFILEGKTVKVSQTGTLPIPVKGTYSWLEDSLQVSKESARELLEGLATATTSLNPKNGGYRLQLSDNETDGWFYDVKAVSTANDALIGEFLIAADMSAVYRIDTEKPILIHGAADSMMAAVRDVAPEEGLAPATVQPHSVPLVHVVSSRSRLPVGETAKVVPVTPGRVPATVACTSRNPEVATVDAGGVITGIGPGWAAITGTISVDGSEKAFRLEIEVVAHGAVRP